MSAETLELFALLSALNAGYFSAHQRAALEWLSSISTSNNQHISTLSPVSFQLEVFAQVHAAHGVVAGQVFGGAGFEQLAFEEQISAVHDAESGLHVVVGDEHADVAVLELGHNALYFLGGNGVDASEGLVEQHKLGVDGQGAGNFGAAPLAATQHLAQVFAHVGEAELGEQLLYLVFPAGFGQVRQL